MTVKIVELMVIERILLEYEANHKFELGFGDAYKLNEYLKKVGKITSYAFLIQEEFHEKYGDAEKLKEYHKMVMGSEIEFDCSDIIEFIGKISKEIYDEKISRFILNNAFWH